MRVISAKKCGSCPSDRACLHGISPVLMGVLITVFTLASTLVPFLANASGTLDAVNFAALPGNRVQLKLSVSEFSGDPTSFTMDNPARIVFDLPNIRNNLVSKKPITVGVGAVKDVVAVEAQGRTRVVLNLDRLTAYETKLDGGSFFVTVASNQSGANQFAAKTDTPPKTSSDSGGTKAAKNSGQNTPQMITRTNPVSGQRRIINVDFRRGEGGEGRIIVNLSDPSTPVNVYEQGGKVVAEFVDAELPEELQRRLDVTDFATPVTAVETTKQGRSIRMEISAVGEFEHLAYQFDKVFTLDVKKVEREHGEGNKKNKFTFNGERLSLNFQDIEVRAVLQLLADFTGLNMVTNDSVQGNVTLRLKNVPWDQALDIILKSKGLSMRQNGNVILIAPSEEIVAREKSELEAEKSKQELSPLYSELIQVNFAKAADMAKLINDEKNSMLSRDDKGQSRGSVAVDLRTNTLMVQATSDKLTQIRNLIAKLDIPVRQVLIESRIVIANNDFARDVGVRTGITAVKGFGNDGLAAASGNLQGGAGSGTGSVINSGLTNFSTSGNAFPVTIPFTLDRLGVNLPASAPNAGKLALSILKSNFLLDLELSALQAEGRGEVVSNPRVITANQKEAVIEQGTEIPYQVCSVVGGVGTCSVQFKKAVLSLKVTPHITPDDRIILDLNVTKDSVGIVYSGIPSIDTKEVTTQVLVNNGETVVLGGIYEQVQRGKTDKIPLLGDLPLLGNLFKRTSKVDDKTELLIFVTPKVLKDGLSAAGSRNSTN